MADSPIAAVPCSGPDELVLLDLSSGDRLGAIPVGDHPVHAAVVDGRTFVATMNERAVTVVDRDGSVRRIETGVLGPSHFATVGDELVVSCSAGDALAVVDPADLAPAGRIGVGAEPHEVAARGDLALVGSRRDGVVDLVDVPARERVNTVRIPSRDGDPARVQGVAVGSGDGRAGATAYAVDQRGARVAAFDVDEAVDDGGGSSEGDVTVGRAPVSAVAEVGADPYDLVVTDDRVLVPGRGSGTVHEFDRDLSAASTTVHGGFETPVEVHGVGDRWWVVDRGAAALRTLDGAARVETPAPAIHAAVVDGRLLLSHYDDALVSLVDPDEGVVWETGVPEYPFGAVVA